MSDAILCCRRPIGETVRGAPMSSLTDLTGRRFGRLVVLRQSANRGRRVTWLCQCSCGRSKRLVTDYLTSKRYRSCGCLRDDTTRKRSTTHGHTIGRHATKEYRAWAHMKGRCYNPTDSRYDNCGGRGIKVCRAWRKSFASFLRDLGPAPENAILKRRDTDDDFTPGNCVWEARPHARSHIRSSRGSRTRLVLRRR